MRTRTKAPQPEHPQSALLPEEVGRLIDEARDLSDAHDLSKDRFKGDRAARRAYCVEVLRSTELADPPRLRLTSEEQRVLDRLDPPELLDLTGRTLVQGSVAVGPTQEAQTNVHAESKRRGRHPSKAVAIIRESIQRAASTGARGKEYCQALDDRRISTPLEWQKREGCPKSYVEAYEHPDKEMREKFRDLIKDQKYKMTH